MTQQAIVYGLMTIMLLWASLWAATARSQEPKVVFEGVPLGVDVEQTLGLRKGAAAAEANSETLNAALQNPAYSNGCFFYFPAGDWYFGADAAGSSVNGTCIQTPVKSGFRFVGNGLRRDSRSGSKFDGPATQIIYAGPRVRFDGSTITATASGSDNILAVTGYKVKSQDVGATLEVTGGRNFVTFSDEWQSAFYAIIDVDTGANTWTLDRNPTTGSTASGMRGLMTYSLWKDRGHGNVYQGINMMGSATAGGTRCHVGLHVETNRHGLNTGKIRVSDCLYADFTAAVMAGRNMASAYRMATAKYGREIGYGPRNDYPGASDNHADNIWLMNVRAKSCRTLFYTRNSQSVGHRLDFIRTINTDEIAYCERSVKILLDDVHMGGGRKRVLRIGKFTTNHGLASLRHVTLDGQSNVGKIVQMDGTPSPGLASPWPATKDSTRGRIIIDGVHIPSGMNDWTEPLVDVYGAVRLVIRNWDEQMIGGTVLLKKHPDDRSYAPHSTIDNSQLSVRRGQEEVIHSGSDAGIRCLFRGNSNYNNSIAYPTNDAYKTP